eukprot:m.581610 g.581610  ORF g.581610 m.581610 type:complete len:70 (+) comp22327_c1_seq1:151-360(+)
MVTQSVARMSVGTSGDECSEPCVFMCGDDLLLGSVVCRMVRQAAKSGSRLDLVITPHAIVNPEFGMTSA